MTILGRLTLHRVNVGDSTNANYTVGCGHVVLAYSCNGNWTLITILRMYVCLSNLMKYRLGLDKERDRDRQSTRGSSLRGTTFADNSTFTIFPDVTLFFPSTGVFVVERTQCLWDHIYCIYFHKPIAIRGAISNIDPESKTSPKGSSSGTAGRLASVIVANEALIYSFTVSTVVVESIQNFRPNVIL